MRETLEGGKLEWPRVITTGAPLALLDLGEGLTDGAIMVACQEDDDDARRSRSRAREGAGETARGVGRGGRGRGCRRAV
jgi:hypothetical protein